MIYILQPFKNEQLTLEISIISIILNILRINDLISRLCYLRFRT